MCVKSSMKKKQRLSYVDQICEDDCKETRKGWEDTSGSGHSPFALSTINSADIKMTLRRGSQKTCMELVKINTVSALCFCGD
jgi:hypothetical protein